MTRPLRDRLIRLEQLVASQNEILHTHIAQRKWSITERFLAIEVRLARIETAGDEMTSTMQAEATEQAGLARAELEKDYAQLAEEQNVVIAAHEVEERMRRAAEMAKKAYAPLSKQQEELKAALDEYDGDQPWRYDRLKGPDGETIPQPIRTVRPDFKAAVAKFLAGESGRAPYVAEALHREPDANNSGPWIVMNGDDKPVVFCDSHYEAMRVLNGEIDLTPHFGLSEGMLTVQFKQP